MHNLPVYMRRSITYVQHLLSRGSRDFEREYAALVSVELRWHRPVLRGEQAHPLKRSAETGEPSFFFVMPAAFLAHPQKHLEGKIELRYCSSWFCLGRARGCFVSGKLL